MLTYPAPLELQAESAGADERRGYLRLDRLSKQFGEVRVLADICLDVGEGELLCVLGPSGSGKSTLLRCIAGLELQSSGTITQGGIEISDLPASARDFGLVFQSYALFPNLTVEGNIGYGLKSLRMPRNERRERVAELVALTGLEPHLRKYPAQLSGGEQQRVALARALAMRPRLLMLDEPLSAVDARIRDRLRGEIVEIQRKLGITTIMVTHDRQEALTIADRIAVMNRGSIEQVGTPQDVYRQPRTAFVADFVGSANLLPAVAGEGGRLRIGTVELAGDASADAMAAGTPLVLCIHPADVEVSPLRHGGRNLVAARVRRIEYFGNFLRVTFELDGTDLSLRADLWANGRPGPGLSEGTEHLLVLPPDRLRVFAAGSEPPSSAARPRSAFGAG